MSLARTLLGSIILATIILLGVGFSVSAQDITNTSAEQVIDKTVIKKGQNYSINNTINGDLYCFGQDVTISGTINGDVFCAAKSINFSGDVNGSARLAGEKVNVSGQVSNNASIVASEINIENSASIGGDLNAAAQNIVINGTILRDFTAVAKNVTINGNVGRDVEVKNASLTVSQNALIGGSVTNKSDKKASIVSSAVTGRVDSKNGSSNKLNVIAGFLLGYVYWFMALMIVSFAVLWLFPKPLVNSVKLANEKPIRVTATGIISVFITPIILFLIALTLIGIPLSILLSLIYIISIFMSGPFFAFLVGSKFLPEQKLWIKMLLGSAIVLIAYSLPVIGFVVAVVASVFGSGMFVSLIVERLPHTKVFKPKHIA